MPLSEKDKAKIIEKDKKIKRLNRMILAKERELDKVELKNEHAKAQVAKGEMSKGEYQRFKTGLSRDRKSIRGAITKYERTRLNRERSLKEKALEKEEKARERQERREEKAREKALKKEAKSAPKSDDDED